MNLSDFDFNLPEELIAQTPPAQRGQSRLMIVERETGEIHHKTFSAFPEFLDSDPVVVFNDTRVLPAKLEGYKANQPDRKLEFLLVREVSPDQWHVLVKGLGKLKLGQKFQFGDGSLEGEFLGQDRDMGRVRFLPAGSLSTQLEKLGRMPLPHYIHRSPGDNLESLDRERYQTVFAKTAGAIAAPTAGLHFNEHIMQKVRQRATTVFLTLHVGPGTFQPVRTEDLSRHKMKEEYYQVPQETWNTLLKAKLSNRKIMAVGTTSTRVLESLEFTEPTQSAKSGWTDRFIYPGQDIKNTRQLLTNFHLPKSTLFLLVCAFAGTDLMIRAYQEAIQEKYRFFSYGDAMLIL